MKKVWIGWMISLPGAIACSYMMIAKYAIGNLISIEFSHSACEFANNIENIGKGVTPDFETLKMNTIWDFGFIAFYTALAFFSMKILLTAFQLKVARAFYILCFIPGVLDVVENAHLLATALSGEIYYSVAYWIAVRIKWAFSILLFLFIPIVMVCGIAALLKGRKKAS